MSDTTYQLSRRSFLQYGTCGTMGIGSLVNTMSQLQLMNSATASTASNISGYKALVCVFLRGGCDMNNILIPTAGNTQAKNYINGRGVVGIPNGVIHDQANPSGANHTLALDGLAQPYGLHPNFKHMQGLFNTGNAAFIANVGTLAESTTKANYGSVARPKQLFSHSDQQTEWMSSIADQNYRSGWGARVAELMNDTWNPQSKNSMLVTAAGNSQFLNGSKVPQYTVTSSGAVSLAGFGDNYKDALTSTGDYKTTARQGRRLKSLERIMAYSHSNLIEDAYATIVKRARDSEEVVSAAVAEVENLNLDFEATFNRFGATDELGDELKAVAKLIAGRKHFGNNRQIFFVDRGGFDMHKNINDGLPKRVESIDNAIGAFNAAMEEIAAADPEFEYDNVTTFQASDFNRTWTPNGSDVETAGTDHAWGTHAFVVGGAVKGRQIYGEFPELLATGANAVPKGNRGRWIPTTAVDQYAAKLAQWLGVPVGSAEMETIFPNLSRFENPFGASSLIDFI